MSPFEGAKTQPADDFLRDVGIHLATFLLILEKVSLYIEAERERRPMKRRDYFAKINFKIIPESIPKVSE
jgi:hypothetical protein